MSVLRAFPQRPAYRGFAPPHPPPAGVRTGEESWSLPPQSRVILVTIHSSPRSSRSCGDSPYRASPADVSSVAVASKLRVTGAEMENMALYLRTSFRLLSSWVHGGGIVELLAAPRFLPHPHPPRWGIRCLPRLPAVGRHQDHLCALPAEMAPSGLQPRAQEHGKALDRNPTLCRRHLHDLWRQQPDQAVAAARDDE
jgi:hypothetical protein